VSARFAELEARDPKNPLGPVLRAKALVQQLPPADYPPEAQTALELLEKALALDEKHAEAHHLIGIVLERKGELDEAAKHLERSIELNSQDPAPHYRLARVYTRLGRVEDAERERRLHEKLSEDVAVVDHRGTAVERRPGAAVAK
jgi:tetratricopeptide (TPR) repeat protein